MKRSIKYGLVGILLLFVGGMGFSIRKSYLHSANKSSPLLDFETLGLTEVSGTPVTRLEEWNAMVVVYFNSTCDLCIHELEQIRLNIHDFGETPLVFISAEERQEIEKITEQFELDRAISVTFLQDAAQRFATVFSVKGVPETFVFQQGGVLKWRFKGPVKVQSILNQIRQ